ncbi:DUF3526 domain-containing protein [Glaciecola siphonariae]|uniref:DUF3526 domain-containing protein n=1 Tax=Glaciecola siphonariae TaxID=521012 RepID=A0ABV9LR68_9ALTE
MIKLIALKHLKVLARSHQLRWLSMATLLITIVALATSYSSTKRIENERNQLNQQDSSLWLEQGSVNPHMAAHFGRYITKPLSPLTFFEPGLTQQLGTVARLEAHKQQAPQYRPAEGGSAILHLGQFTPAMAFQLLLPLIIILASFNAFSGLHANALIRQEVASGIKPSQLVFGRFISIVIAVFFICLPISISLMVLSSFASLDAVMSSTTILFAYFVYFGIWVAISLGVSALCRQSRNSLTVLLSFWFICCFIVPRFSADVSEYLHPTPTAPEFKSMVKKALQGGPSGHNSSDERLAEYRQAVLEQYGVENIEDLPVNWDGLALQEGERIATQIGNNYYDELWQTYRQQALTRSIFTIISPLIAMQQWSSGIASTDVESHIHFSEAIEGFRFSFVSVLNNDIANNAAKQSAWDYQAAPELLQEVQSFTYAERAISERLHLHWTSLILLITWLVIALMFASLASKRLER